MLRVVLRLFVMDNKSTHQLFYVIIVYRRDISLHGNDVNPIVIIPPVHSFLGIFRSPLYSEADKYSNFAQC